MTKKRSIKAATLLFVLFACSWSFSQETTEEIGPMQVVGGSNVAPGEFPWVVSLAMSNGDPGCGASLIRPQWVLTAGHCHLDIDFPDIPAIEQVIINSVTIDIETLEPFSELIDVEEIIPHEDYEGIFGGGGGPDIALIRLATPASTTPVELATYSDAEYFSANMPAQVLGWGKIEAGGSSVDSLLHADCIFISHDTCATMYEPEGDDSFFNLNPDGNICAGFFSGDTPAGAAQGDSGGPLFFEDPDGNYKQVGVVSGGNSDVTTEDFPGIFTLVPEYIDWIENTIADYEIAASIETQNREAISISILDKGAVGVNGLSEESDYNLSVFNLAGSMIEQVEVSGLSHYELDMVQEGSGMYVIQLLNKSKGKVTVEKFIMQ